MRANGRATSEYDTTEFRWRFGRYAGVGFVQSFMLAGALSACNSGKAARKNLGTEIGEIPSGLQSESEVIMKNNPAVLSPVAREPHHPACPR
ncbi:MAG: hypothetical protein L3K26_11645, partial [Candidatus Hydrogenedentes bacterium]|nr:hypothetical protein [Candidatus Hydrogenedentota bacterium]